MELRQLEYFVAVAEEASFTRAAEHLHVAQPGVSAQIRLLERELGHDLFERSHRTVRLTQVGVAVLEYARAALQASSGARQVVQEFIGLLRGRVSVGMVVACSSLDLSDLLADFHRRHPSVEIELNEAHSNALLASLTAGELDLAFVALGPAVPHGIETRPVVDEPLVAAVTPSDPLARAHAIDLDVLRERSLIGMPQGTGVRAVIDAACAAAGFQPHFALEASNPGTVAQLAVRGLGLAILPESVAASFGSALRSLPVEGAALRGQLALAWRGNGARSPAARTLIELARAKAAGSRSQVDRRRRGGRGAARVRRTPD
ncbi:MAG: LysR family transcriptional regulator [Chloroflexota bacterium]|nr:LysR family transcriptional regulator [Chloroflexota bacterium]